MGGISTREVNSEQFPTESDEKYRLLFENASDLIFVLDANGRIVNVSPSIEAILGYKPSEILGKTPEQMGVLSPAMLKRREEWALKLRPGRATDPHDYEVLNKGGETVILEVVSTPIYRGGTLYAILNLGRDVTARKQVEEHLQMIHRERQKLLDQAYQIGELKSSLITQAAHELKTPLTAILGWGDLLLSTKKQGKTTDDACTLEAYESITRNARRINNIINDFLDVEKIESRKFELNPQVVDLQAILDAVLNSVDFSAKQKHITFTIDWEARVPLFVDRARMEQVFANLFSNAIKYSPENGAVLVKTGVGVFNGRRMFRIEVIDNGFGFTPEELVTATTSFGKVYTQQPQKRAVQGTGLGLCISRYIVELHGGIFVIRSGGENKGTTVEILLPF